MARYQPVDPRADFPMLEREILEFWRDARIFEKSVELRKDAPEWVFYEGPPTANGRPGIHHVESRTFKDIYPRYRTMTGHQVPRKAGWDCHGLPVELEVEKEIGTTSKRDIEAFGIGEFNRLCRESVTEYVQEWNRLTERIGFWIDLSDPYWTMDPEYVESVWWSLKRLHDDGLLFEADRITAYCPRCGTALSDHEVSLGYEDVEDPSVFVRFPITESQDPELTGAALLVWTTTPWTLISNTGVAVHPDEMYARVATENGDVIVADALRETAVGEGAGAKTTFPGSRLTDGAGTRYEPPFPNVPEGVAHRVVAADWVAMNEGSGVVHMAPAFGAEDLEIGAREDWPVFKPVDDAGRFTDLTQVEFVRGEFVKDADPAIVEDLRRRGLLLRAETYRHTYPLCWRCSTPLIYYARTAWYVRTTARKERLLEVNESVNWYPDHVKHGRYGNWLENNVDWALSRERYWGTPLPVWRCENGHVTVVDSLKSLSDLAGRDVTDVDPHRPAIDEIAIRCGDCGTEARRVPEVIDTWYDSGAMPFAQWSYHPELGRGLEEFQARFPADFISEAVDQTRGWFYSLMAEGVLLFDESAYRTCVVLGHVVDRQGRKMSKSLGNVLDPWTVIDRHGADALRWFMLTSGSPWSARRVYPEAFDEVVRRFLLTLWNVYSFFVTYANADGFDPADHDVPAAERPALDRWALSQLAATARLARERLDDYDATAAGRRIERFVDDLSNWYVRRARRRFWDPAGSGDEREKWSAYLTLQECLTTAARLLAPFTPFVADAIWRGLGGEAESVHLADYPAPASEMEDPGLDEAMAKVRTIASLGRTVRNDARVKVRQPLPRAVVHIAGDPATLEPLATLIEEELNVREVVFTESEEGLSTWRAKPSFRALGPRLGGAVKQLARILADDDGRLAARLARGEAVSIDLDGREVTLEPGDVEMVQEARSGWGTAAEGGVTVALDLEITEELRREGIARDLVRLIQDARKAAGLQVSDRIDLSIQAGGAVTDAMETHRAWIAGEVLAARIEPGVGWEAAHREYGVIEGLDVAIALRPARGSGNAAGL